MSASVIITLGNKAELSITKDNHLLVTQRMSNGSLLDAVDLGLATKSRFRTLKEHISRLEIHAIEGEGPVF